MRQQHIQMPFVDRHVGGFANGPARMMKVFRHIPQFHKFLKIAQSCVTTPTITIADKGGAVDRRSHKSVSANFYVALRVARVLDELRWGCFAQLPRKTAWDPNALILDRSSNRPPAFQSFRAVNKIHTDFFEHRLGIILDDFKCCLIQKLIQRNVTFNVTFSFDAHRCAFSSAGGAAAAA